MVVVGASNLMDVSCFLNLLGDREEASLFGQLFAMFFLKDPTGGHPTTGAGELLQSQKLFMNFLKKQKLDVTLLV